MQCRNHAIELIPTLGLATMVDEDAIFGPQFGDRFPSLFGVSLSEYIVEVASKEGLYRIGHGALTARGMRRAVPPRIGRAAQRPRNVRRGRPRSNRTVANRPARPTIAAVETIRRGKCSRRPACRAAASRNRARNSQRKGARRMRACW